MYTQKVKYMNGPELRSKHLEDLAKALEVPGPDGLR
jgi:hypothetical protein